MDFENATEEELDEYLNKWGAILNQRKVNQTVSQSVDLMGGGGKAATALGAGAVAGGIKGILPRRRTALRALKSLDPNSDLTGQAAARLVSNRIMGEVGLKILKKGAKAIGKGLPGAKRRAAKVAAAKKVAEIEKQAIKDFRKKKWGNIEHHKKAAFKMAGKTKVNIDPILQRLDPDLAAKILQTHGNKLSLKEIDQLGRTYKENFRPLANKMMEHLATGSAGPRLKSAATRYNRAVKAGELTEGISSAKNLPRMNRGNEPIPKAKDLTPPKEPGIVRKMAKEAAKGAGIAAPGLTLYGIYSDEFNPLEDTVDFLLEAGATGVMIKQLIQDSFNSLGQPQKPQEAPGSGAVLTDELMQQMHPEGSQQASEGTGEATLTQELLQQMEAGQ